MKFWKKVCDIINKLSSELIYNKKKSKSGKKFVTKKSTQKKAFSVFMYE